MERLGVHLDGKEIYDIVITDSFDGLEEEVGRLRTEGKKLCIVTDSHVEKLYLEEVKERLSKVCRQVDVFVFPAGEEFKNLDTVRDLYKYLIRQAYDRKDVLAALGGGVTGDLCGYAAATYLRGIDFIQIPTTLLAQVDSSIGGKTGVDFDAYKHGWCLPHAKTGLYECENLTYLIGRTVYLGDGRSSQARINKK